MYCKCHQEFELIRRAEQLRIFKEFEQNLEECNLCCPANPVENTITKNGQNVITQIMFLWKGIE